MAVEVAPGSVFSVPAPEGSGLPKTRFIADKYEVGRKLGAGLQGKVYLGKRMDSGQLVALKVMDYPSIAGDRRKTESLSKELNAMSRLAGHPNVVRLIDYIIPTKMEKKHSSLLKDIVLVVLELANGGELFDFMSHTGPFPEDIARFYFKQLLQAMYACHEAGVFHRDLKPENLLLDDSFNLKVADFGLSSLVVEESGAPSLLHTECGTPGYMAPEILRHQAYDGAKADIWSMAAVLFIMVAGFPPFKQATPGDWWYDRVRENRHSLFWAAHSRSHAFSGPFMDLINTMFQDDPARRATLDSIMSHPWVNGSIPAASTIQTELIRRKAVIDEAKAAEREREAAKRRADEASGGTDFDVLTSSTVRSAPSLGSASAASLPAGPLPAELRDSPHSFFVHGSAEGICDLIEAAAVALGASAKSKRREYNLKLKVEKLNGSSFDLRVFETDAFGVHVVVGTKSLGDSLSFAKGMEALHAKVTDDAFIAEAGARASGGGGGGGSGSGSGAGVVGGAPADFGIPGF